MRNTIFCLSLGFLLYIVTAHPTYAQLTQRAIKLNFIKGDSVNLALNDDFNMIEDSCAVISRCGHFDIQKHIFTGAFKDVLRSSPDMIITQGNFNNQGLKDGPFIINFANGNPQARGSFKDGVYDGQWQVFYADGKPRLNFKADAGAITITDAWDASGKKTVDNGKGTYRADATNKYWKGKLLNGVPDGTWRSVLVGNGEERDWETESFKNGVFENGNWTAGEYHSGTHLVLIAKDMFPFTQTERLMISPVPCDGTKHTVVVNARYQYGMQLFSNEIGNLVSPYISQFYIKDFDNEIDINGYVGEKGNLTELKSSGMFRVDIAHGLILQLMKLPPLIPATVDGKPAKQKISFKFLFYKGVFNYRYGFGQVDAN